MLCMTGFGMVWLQQGVGCVKSFLKTFKQRLIDMFIQEWSGTIRDRERYENYKHFKIIFEKEKYISEISPYCFRVAITQLRFNVLPLNNNAHRYSNVLKEKMCPFCRNAIKNEYHFISECPYYKDLRNRFLPDVTRLPMEVLMKVSNSSHRYQMSRYVFLAMDRRNKGML